MNRLERERLEIQARLDALKTQRDRNAMGQFATPGPLATELLESARSMLGAGSKGIRFLDPAFGTGAFYSALLRVFSPESIAAAYGYEIDPHYGVPASRLWEPTGLRLRLEDFTASAPDGNGAERVDLLVCNPPYVRHHHIEPALKRMLAGRAMKELGIRVSGLAGLYVHFMLMSHRWLNPDGLSIWLVPSEFLDVNYGSALKEYLLNHVDLIRIHRFDPEKVQFDDALVSSAVVWFRKRAPDRASRPKFTLGGTLDEPRKVRPVPRDELRREAKWTRFPEAGAATSADGPALRDFFRVKRGVVTGANGFFIMDQKRVEELRIPGRFLRPVLPSPRYLDTDVVEADGDGVPRLDRRLFLFDCRLPLGQLDREAPVAAAYIRHGEARGVHAGYLASRREPWYALESRGPSPFVCTYMGRSTAGTPPFRVILNESRAIVTNVYLMLYPKPPLERFLATESARRSALASLNGIVGAEWRTNGRVYGGGLYKLEPRELGSLAADALVEAFPRFESGVAGQMRMRLDMG